jgi:hypothetical protein
VTAVNAIEIADRDGAGRALRPWRQLAKDLHEVRLDRQEVAPAAPQGWGGWSRMK